ncbi:MAG TPA: glycosyltransferase [Terriglobia bacterium]|nr:glycosyltransferase [Terriglobia bacterium]
MSLLYVLAAIAIFQGIVSLLDGIRASRYMRTFRPRRTTGERVLVFCPCKGIDPEFEKNIRSILEQDYSNFSVRFIVDSQDDPAYPALQEIGIRDVLVAGRASNCGQKVHNLTYAVQHAATPADILVFCDSDARFDRQWLKKLIAPLDTHAITTGYRWYVSSRFHLPTLLRSAWNASVVSMLGAHDRNFAWGGSMAIRRSTFDEIGVLDAWRGSVSDDYSVSRAAQRSGTRIVFVPECLVPSHGECTFRELLEFTNRQITITRVYHPRIWRIGFIAQAVTSIAFVTLPFTSPLLWLTIYGLSAAKAWMRLSAVRSVLPQPGLSKFGWFYILVSPAIALLYLYNMICSALGTDIVWRQIHYKLVSPNETRVFGDSGASGS